MRRQAAQSLLARAVACIQQQTCTTSATSGPLAQLAKGLHTSTSGVPSLSPPSISTSGLNLTLHHAAGRQGMVPAAGWARTMFIQTQPTPNPQSLMFVPGKPVMESGSYEFPNARAGMVSPLAKKLFAIDGVTAVFFGSDFLTVTKRDEYTWPVLKPDVFAAIMDFYASNQPLFLDSQTLAASDTAIHEDDDEVVAMIKELLETRIRPAVQEDGGDIAFRSFDPDTGIVTVKMQGACSGCPSSAVTLKSGIENMLMHYIPEVKQVQEAPPDEGEQEAISEFEKFEAKLEGSAKAASA